MPGLQRLPTFLILSLLALLLAAPLLGYALLQIEGPRVRQEALVNLDSVGLLKAKQIEAWLRERRGDAEMLMHRTGLINDLDIWFKQGDPTAGARIASRVAALRQGYGYQVELLDASRGLNHLSADRRALLAAALDSRQPQLGELYRDNAGQIWLDLITPLIHADSSKQIGAILLRSPANDFLFPFIQTWPSASPSAETLLIRRDGDQVLFLNELRHRQGASLALRLPLDDIDLPAAIALRTGKAQILEGRDYRDIPVLAATRPVQGTDWMLVAKIDRDEVMQPLHARVAWIGGVTLFSGIALALALLLLWRQQQRGHQLELLARTGELNRLLSMFYDLPFMGMAIINPSNGRWLHVNQRLCEMLGYSRKEILSDTTWQQLTDPADLDEATREYQRLISGNSDGYQLTERLRCKDGSYIDVDLAAKCVHHHDGRPEYVIKTIRDISQQKRSEAALRASEQRFQSMANAAPVLIWIAGPDQLCSWFNQQWLDFTGRALVEEIGNGWAEGVHPDDLPQCLVVYNEHFARREPFEMEYRLRRADGEYRWILDRGKPHFSPADEFLGYIGSCVDVTARKLADDTRRENEERLRLALNAAHAGSWDWHIRTGHIVWSPENYALYGLDPQAGMPTEADWQRKVHPDDLTRVLQAIADVRDGRVSEYRAEFRVRGPEFGERWLSGMGRIERGPDGAPQRMIGINLDITARKRIEQALEAARMTAIEEKNLLEAVMQTLPVGVAIVDNRGGAVNVNPGYELIWRGPRPSFDSVGDYTRYLAWWADSGEPLQAHEWASARAIETGQPVANQLLRIQRFDATYAYVLNSAAPIRDIDGNIFGSAVVIQDITDIKAVEQALRASEERFQLSAEIGRTGTWDWNIASGDMIWSRSHYEILGYQPDEVAPGYPAWLDRVHPDDRPQIEAEIPRCMREHQDFVAVYRVIWPDQSLHWMSARGRFEYTADGVCQRMLGAMADVTSMKQAEQALREADQRKDEFLAMLAHELRNPLAPIRNAAHILGRLQVNEPRVRWAQNIIERQVSHLTHLVDELLDVSRIARGKITLNRARIELTDLINQTREAMQPVMEAKRHQFRIALPASEVILEGDLIRLIQVLQNLLDNAAKYTPEGGRIELTGHLLDGELELRVRDNGMGIPAELLPEVFKPFQQGERTLDRSQGGLGIGLTLVHRLVELHGGRVTAQSAGSGCGASFSVWLPLAQSAPAQSTPTPSAPTELPPAGTSPSLRVLVVDDDPLVAESMLVFLELEGHQVRSAESGETALRLLPAFAPQVVLLDIGLPGQDGYEVARAIRRMPGGDALELIAVSGYGHEEAMLRSRQAGFDEHLVKPVDPERIRRMLSEIATRCA